MYHRTPSVFKSGKGRKSKQAHREAKKISRGNNMRCTKERLQFLNPGGKNK
jgi:hypothetical protein